MTYVALGILNGASISVDNLINIGILVVAPCILGGILFVVGTKEEEKKKRIVTFIKIALYITYILLLACLMLLGNRHDLYSSYSYWEYLKYNSNFVPFATIIEYLNHYKNNTINMNIIFENLVGNLMLFMPMGVFLPCLYVKRRTWKGFLSYLILIIFLIEAIQSVTRAGAFDVDDFILNITGACIVFAIVKTKMSTNFLKRIYFYS